MLFRSPIIFSLSIYLACIFGYMVSLALLTCPTLTPLKSSQYLFFTTFDIVFGENYHFSTGAVGLAYLPLGLGMFSGLVFVLLCSDKLLVRSKRMNNGVSKPEFRLPPMAYSCLFLPTGLFWYGWAANARIHWIVPMMGQFFIGGGIVLTMVSLCQCQPRPPERF